MIPTLLKVVDGSPADAEIVVESTGYITIRIGKDLRHTNVYWRLVDSDFSLLELGFEWPSGRLVHCSIPLFKGDVEHAIKATPQETVRGIPLFDLSPWQRSGANPPPHISKEGRVRMILHPNEALSIILDNARQYRSVVYGDRIECVVGEAGGLCAINVRGDFAL